MACSKLAFVMLLLLVAAKTNSFHVGKLKEINNPEWDELQEYNKPENIKPEWDELRVTFPKYNGLPMTSNDAKKEGWTSISVCDNNAYFRGNRYILHNDPAVMLLFDSNGKIAGIQCGVPKLKATGGFFNKDYWVEDGDILVVTAYFVDPNVICNGEREDSEYLGDSLSIQLGKTPSSLMRIPLNEDDTKETKWVKGACLKGMGVHYWYDISTNMSCDDLFPSFLMYNKGKLNVFGWLTIGDFHSSRFEHPPAAGFYLGFQPGPQPLCGKDLSHLSTIHVFLQNRPDLNSC